MGRGRPAKLQGRQTTCISLEDRHREYLKNHHLEVSQHYRDYLDLCIKNEESPIAQLEREIEELDKHIEEQEMIRAQKIQRLQELKKEQEDNNVRQKELEEAERKKIEYIIGYKEHIRTDGKCRKMWLDHLLEAYDFKTYSEAKSYVHDVWVEDGVPEKNVKAFLGIN